MLAAKGRIYWRLLRTKSAEQALIAAAKSPAYAAEAQYWLGRIYSFKGSQAEGAYPGWHEEVSYRPRATAAFTAAGEPKAEWVAAIETGEAKLKLLDARIAMLQSSTDASVADLRAAIDARTALRPDPMSYALGANLLLARRADLPHVMRMAAEGQAAGERFIRENESSYKLDGKVQASLDRNRAGFADIAGWAAFLQGDIKIAEERLAESARLSRGLDSTNQLHLAELSRKKGDLENAREHYLTLLGLAGATPVQRDQAKTALADVQAKSGESPAEYEKWLAATLERKREERRKALVSNMAGKKLPALVLTDLQGHKVDLQAERGNVVLLNFFSAW
ncbi:MAG: hypothetical protein Q7R30_02160 [Acidobacteriota bacterium]|nr:hypothetical protein [Acidobacteriota bacterium]